MKLDTVADWQSFLSFRFEECRQMCCNDVEMFEDHFEISEEWSHLERDADKQLRMLCDRAREITKRVSREKKKQKEQDGR